MEVYTMPKNKTKMGVSHHDASQNRGKGKRVGKTWALRSYPGGPQRSTPDPQF